MPAKSHILIVEDEEHLAVGIKYNLTVEGYQVTVAGDGAQALKCLQDPEKRVDLVVLDIMLPGMSGYTVCETIRATQNDIPILLLSARTLAEDRARGFDVGANQYLTKPFDLDELLSRVRNLLKHSVSRLAPTRPVAGVYRFGTAVVNFDTFQVSVGAKPVHMTKLELELLKHFIDNEQRVIPRQELLEEVWKLPAHISTRAPDQFIRRLRKIFEPNPSQPRYFRTIRDAGYQFVSDGDGRGQTRS